MPWKLRGRANGWSALGTSLVAGALLTAVVACRAATDVTLVVTTDIPCASHGGTSIAVGPRGGVEARTPAAETTTCIDGRIGSLVLVPSGSNDADLDVRVVTGIGTTSPSDCVASGYATRGCIVARRSLAYVAHEGLTVAVAMRASCEAVDCGVTGTCVRGQCASATVDTSTCTSSAGCDESGLEPRPGGLDAGAPSVDAGVADAALESATPVLDAGPADGSLPTKCDGLTGVVAYNPANDHCYWSPPGGAITAQAALTLCTQRKTAKEHPVSITSRAENDFVAAMGATPHWLGLYKGSGGPGGNAKGDYRWTTQEPVTFDGWAPGFPSGAATCVAMRADGAWTSVSCEATSIVFCERD